MNSSILAQRAAEVRRSILNQSSPPAFSLSKPVPSKVEDTKVEGSQVHSTKRSTQEPILTEKKELKKSKIVRPKKSLLQQDESFECKTCSRNTNVMIYGHMEVCSWTCYLEEFRELKKLKSNTKKASVDVR